MGAGIGALFLIPVVPVAVLVCVAAALTFRWFRIRRGDPHPPVPTPGRIVAHIAIVEAVAAGAVGTAGALLPPAGWDLIAGVVPVGVVLVLGWPILLFIDVFCAAFFYVVEGTGRRVDLLHFGTSALWVFGFVAMWESLVWP